MRNRSIPTACGLASEASRPKAKPQAAKAFWRRLILGATAFIGTAVYIFSFRAAAGAQILLPAAAAIGISAGMAWIGFGLMLLRLPIVRRDVLLWIDACLVAMSAGIGLKMIGVVANFTILANRTAPVIAVTHAILLVSADVLMGVIFVRRAARLGLLYGAATVAWIVGLNGLFILLLTLCASIKGVIP